jgi:antitoxin ParD1/3/4
MGTKNISLPPELEAYIDAKVASGSYSHASEVVRDALRGMMREEAEKFEWLRNAIAEGVKSADEGPLLSGQEALDDVKRRGRELLAARRAKT